MDKIDTKIYTRHRIHIPTLLKNKKSKNKIKKISKILIILIIAIIKRTEKPQ